MLLFIPLLYSTLIACTKEPVFNNWFVESMYYLERVGRLVIAIQ